AHHPHGGHPEAVRYGFRPHARRPRRLDGADQPLRPARRLPRLRRRRRIRPGGAAADPLHRPRAVVYPHLLPGDRGSMSQPTTPAATYTVQRKRRWTAASIGEMVALIFLIVIIMLPLYWMVSTSLKTANDTFAVPPVFVFKPTFDHYQVLFDEGRVPSSLVNSLIVAVFASLLALVLGTPAAYALARFDFRGKSHLWFWIISNRFISPIVVAVPFFLLARDL